MNALRLVALLLYTFGACAYGAVLFLWTRQLRPAWWGPHRGRPPADLAGGSLFVLGFLWFLDNLLLTLANLGPRRDATFLQFAQLWLAFAFPPVIMHVAYSEVYVDCPPRSRMPWALVWLAYVVTQAVSALAVLAFLRVVPFDVGRTVAFANYVLVTSFLAAAGYSIALIVRARRPSPTRRELQARRWLIGAFGFMFLIFLVLLASPGMPSASVALAGTLELASRSLPLLFMFVGTYFQNRFSFYDLFVKRGIALMLTIGALTAYFAIARPRLNAFDASWAAPWIYAITLLPVIGLLVWLYRRIAAVLDRRWLGRRYTAVEAVKHFIGALRSATTEPQLVEQAERGLAEIFDAPVRVELGGDGPPPFDAQEEVPIGSGDRPAGRIWMGPRASEAPYFSQDLALLASLADVLASVLDNLRLQARKLEQEQLARELSLNASRSELKALRAQINPHFLFNALNAIAGLIHRNPANADRTIEQLAEVFRYALRGSNSEWAVLGDELEFVRAYLEVERARFGDRLRAEVRVADGAGQAVVPTMVVQTLVENAVKHGAASVVGPAVVEVDARRDGDRIIVSVIDNGPGFDQPPSSRHAASRREGGYGLANIRQRLEGYFGPSATLSIDRDAGRGLTVVSIDLPFSAEAAS